MKHLLIFLFSILVTSNAQAGELDGRALECDLKYKGNVVRTYYWVFDDKYAVFLHVTTETPLKIRSRKSPYKTTFNKVLWNNYELDRRNLVLVDREVPHWIGQCKLTTPAEIEKTLNKELDKLRAEMKKNKL